MEQDKFDQQIREFRERIMRLNRPPDPAISAGNIEVQQALEDIQGLMEELQVAEEELRTQNEQLTEAHHELELEQRRYKDLFQFAPDGYLVTDEYGSILEANQAACVMMNVPENYIVGKALAAYIASDQISEFRTLMSSINLQSGVIHKEFIILPRKSEPFPAAITIAPALIHGTGRPEKLSLRWMIRDITEQKQILKALHDSNENLEARVAERTAELTRKNQELQDFAFIASHDMQEPLRKIKTFGELVMARAGASLDPEARDFLSRMLKAAERMDGMLQGLLNYSRVTTRAQGFRSTDLCQVLHEVVSDLDIRIEETKAKIEIQPLPTIQADPNQMRQLFQNLIVNSLKFKKAGEIPEIKIWSEEAKPGIINIFVQDKGIGFDEKLIDQIFQPFHRLHGISQYEGAGMGLAICQKIVARHSGQITATSTQGEGATFVVTLPIKQVNS